MHFYSIVSLSQHKMWRHFLILWFSLSNSIKINLYFKYSCAVSCHNHT